MYDKEIAFYMEKSGKTSHDKHYNNRLVIQFCQYNRLAKGALKTFTI